LFNQQQNKTTTNNNTSVTVQIAQVCQAAANTQVVQPTTKNNTSVTLQNQSIPIKINTQWIISNIQTINNEKYGSVSKSLKFAIEIPFTNFFNICHIHYLKLNKWKELLENVI
jgi:hypothetical protein